MQREGQRSLAREFGEAPPYFKMSLSVLNPQCLNKNLCPMPKVYHPRFVRVPDVQFEVLLDNILVCRVDDSRADKKRIRINIVS